MIWRDEWNAIAARIDGLVAAASFLSQTLLIDKNDPQTICHDFYKQAAGIVEVVRTFVNNNRDQMPAPVSQAIDGFLSGQASKLSPEVYSQVEYVRVGTCSLAFLRSQVDYLLTDFSTMVQKRSERAFLHLQQCIVADSNIRAQWQSAFNNREPACEMLGAAHLLLHGIFAFKVRGGNAETDLVFNEPIDLGQVGRVAENEAESAKKQSDIYRSGVLGGLELTAYRYIVLVSDHQLPEIPADKTENNVIYRHINIAVDPLPPSKAAK